MKTIVLALCCVLGLVGQAWAVAEKEAAVPPYLENAVELNLAEWREKPIPKVWSEAWYELSRGKECYVFEHEGRLLVSNFRPGSAFEYCVEDGCFSGYSKGEFGGELVFKPLNGEAYRVMQGNPVAIFNIAGKIYLLAGLAHLGFEEGWLYALEQQGANYTISELHDFAAAPRVVVVEGSTAYILVDKRLFRFYDNNGATLLEPPADTEFMFALYPHSMVKKGDELIIGMRGCVTVFNLKNNNIKLLVKP